jgi:hypothetical protein
MRRRQPAIASAPRNATAADSVASRKAEEDRTDDDRSSTSGGSRSGSVRQRASQRGLIFVPAPVRLPQHAISTVRLNSTVRMNPGMNPAR